MPKQFCVNFTRTYTISGSIVIPAKNSGDAEDKAKAMADSGKFGEIAWKLKDAAQAIRDAEIDTEEETIDIEEANQVED